jgi:hypothetical protein
MPRVRPTLVERLALPVVLAVEAALAVLIVLAIVNP